MADAIKIDDQPISSTFFGQGKWLTEFVTPDNEDVQRLYKQVTENLSTKEEKAKAAWYWVASKVKYVSFVKATLNVEGRIATQKDFWGEPSLTIHTKIGNCLSGETKLPVVNPNGEFEIKKIKDLENHNSYSVVSYNFKANRVEIKPITGWFDNGTRRVMRVHFNNGENLMATPDHVFFCQTEAGIEEITLGEAIQGDSKIINILCVPPLSRYNPSTYKYTEEHLWTVGHYLAEGHSERSKVVICNDDERLITKLCMCLDSLKVPYSKTALSSSNYVRVLHRNEGSKRDGIRDLQKSLILLGSTAPNKALTPDFLSLGRPQLENIMQGYCDGDSYLPCRVDRKRKFSSKHHGDYHYKNSYVLRHSTSSEILADQLKLIHLILRRPLWSWYRDSSGGAGENPLPQYVLQESKNPSYGKTKNYFKPLGELKIQSSEDAGEVPVYDIEVQDNHNFMLLSGTLVHNCANKSFLLASLLRNFIDESNVKCVFGNLCQKGVCGGHAWCSVQGIDGVYIMETTRDDVPAFIPAEGLSIYEPVIYFNDKGVEAVPGRTLLVPFSAVYASWLSDYINQAAIAGGRL